jgi:SAM-dependent methyltransferase
MEAGGTVGEARPRAAAPAPALDPAEVAAAYDREILTGHFQEDDEYYLRYRSRYERVLQTYAALGGDHPLDVLEVGGGQHALLAHALLGDRATVADLPGPHLELLEARGLATRVWDLQTDEQPFREAFDRVFLCEVMAHVPVPAHVYLERLRLTLRPGGVLLLTTPNLHRVRNLALLAAGRDPFGYFARPEPGEWLGNIVDFSAPHLGWQLDRAGFVDVDIRYQDFPHRATSTTGRAANLALRPLTVVPRLRYNLVATAVAP